MSERSIPFTTVSQSASRGDLVFIVRMYNQESGHVETVSDVLQDGCSEAYRRTHPEEAAAMVMDYRMAVLADFANDTSSDETYFVVELPETPEPPC